MDVLDLRTALAKVRRWDTLAWDGTTLTVVHDNLLASRATFLSLLEIVVGLPAFTAIRESYRKVYVTMGSAEEVLHAAIQTHRMIAMNAYAQLFASQPRLMLEGLIDNPRTPPDAASCARQILAHRAAETRNELYEETPYCVEDVD